MVLFGKVFPMELFELLLHLLSAPACLYLFRHLALALNWCYMISELFKFMMLKLTESLEGVVNECFTYPFLFLDLKSKIVLCNIFGVCFSNLWEVPPLSPQASYLRPDWCCSFGWNYFADRI